jgi:Rrf2 family iron-sulfur cluster assembly transcriptional regulator
MRLTTKGRFAVTAMIDLAMRQQSGPVTLAGISQRQNISLSYLEQLFGKLRRHELVRSIRGPGGGYTLARLAHRITVAAIIVAVDEPIDATHCGGKQDCASGIDGKPGKCMTHELWAALNRRMVDYLESVSLQNLVEQQRGRQCQPSRATGQDNTVAINCMTKTKNAINNTEGQQGSGSGTEPTAVSSIEPAVLL